MTARRKFKSYGFTMNALAVLLAVNIVGFTAAAWTLSDPKSLGIGLIPEVGIAIAMWITRFQATLDGETVTVKAACDQLVTKPSSSNATPY